MVSAPSPLLRRSASQAVDMGAKGVTKNSTLRLMLMFWLGVASPFLASKARTRRSGLRVRVWNSQRFREVIYDKDTSLLLLVNF